MRCSSTTIAAPIAEYQAKGPMLCPQRAIVFHLGGAAGSSLYLGTAHTPLARCGITFDAPHQIHWCGDAWPNPWRAFPYFEEAERSLPGSRILDRGTASLCRPVLPSGQRLCS